MLTCLHEQLIGALQVTFYSEQIVSLPAEKSRIVAGLIGALALTVLSFVFQLQHHLMRPRAKVDRLLVPNNRASDSTEIPLIGTQCLGERYDDESGAQPRASQVYDPSCKTTDACLLSR